MKSTTVLSATWTHQLLPQEIQDAMKEFPNIYKYLGEDMVIMARNEFTMHKGPILYYIKKEASIL